MATRTKEQAQGKDMLTTGEAAMLLGVARLTLYRWIKAGKISAVVLPSGQHKIRRADIEKMLG